MRRSLTKPERLKRKSDFDRVFGQGTRVNGTGSRLIVLENQDGLSRFAVCPVRKYGTAVARNRAKRICREVYRNHKDRIASGYDVIFVIYPGSDTLPKRTAQFMRLCERSGILRT